MTTVDTLKQAATQRYQQELAAIEQAAHQAEQAQQRLDALDRQRQAAIEAELRKQAAIERFEQIADQHSARIQRMADKIATWRAEVEQAAALVLDARDRAITNRQEILAALGEFASECAALTDIPPGELLAMTADAAHAMTAGIQLSPAIDTRLLANVRLGIGWGAWLGQADSRSAVVERALNKTVGKTA